MLLFVLTWHSQKTTNSLKFLNENLTNFTTKLFYKVVGLYSLITETRSWAPIPKWGAKEECHSFLSKGAMWDWHSYLWRERKYERPSSFTLFFWNFLFSDIIFQKVSLFSITPVVYIFLKAKVLSTWHKISCKLLIQVY